MVLDLRRVIGSRVNAKAIHVTNNAECSRRYGAAKLTKRLDGTVLQAEEVLMPPNRRASWFITANYDLGAGAMKTKRLNIRSVKNGEIPAVALPAPPTLPIAPLPPPIVPIIALDPLGPPIEPTQGDPPSENDPEELNLPQNVTQNVPQNLPPPIPPLSPPPAPEPTTIAHETEWWSDNDATHLPMGGAVHQREWHIRTRVGDALGPGSDCRKDYSPLDYFLLMFPPDQLSIMVTLKNKRLISADKPAITTGEMLKFLGVLVVITRF
jgi:hypothetical protein